MRYYKVSAKRGHQGCGRTTPITFYIQADNAIKASSIAQSMAGTKHSKGIMSCVPITVSEYLEGRKISAYQRADFGR